MHLKDILRKTVLCVVKMYCGVFTNPPSLLCTSSVSINSSNQYTKSFVLALLIL